MLLAVLRTKRSVFLLKVSFGLCVNNGFLVSYKVVPLAPMYSVSHYCKVYIRQPLLVDVGLNVLIDMPEVEKL